MHQCMKFILFWNDTLHVSDGFSVHHQEFKTVHSATGICPASKQMVVSDWQMPVAVCTVLNSWWWMERPSKTYRVSFQNKINLIYWCIWLVLLYKKAWIFINDALRTLNIPGLIYLFIYLFIYCFVVLFLQGLQTESSDEDGAEDTPLFSPDGVEGYESQPHQYYVIEEKFEMVCISKREQEWIPVLTGYDFCAKSCKYRKD